MNNQERFFADEYVAETIKLTEEEVTLFKRFEYEILCMNGLRQISGGYASVTIYDVENQETNNEILNLEVECGIKEEGQSNTNKWLVAYNRKTKTFEGRY